MKVKIKDKEEQSLNGVVLMMLRLHIKRLSEELADETCNDKYLGHIEVVLEHIMQTYEYFGGNDER